METFIVLGLCFILYEALDLFQSCYNNQHHNQQQQQQRPRHRRRGEHYTRQNTSNGLHSNGANSGDDDNDCDSNSVKDTAHLVHLDRIDEIDSEDNQFDNNPVFSICDRVIRESEAGDNSRLIV